MDDTRIREITWAALRVVAGALFAIHGSDKLFGWPGVHPQPEMWSQVWIGGVLELACGALIALGLFTRAAAFVASGMMAVAYFQMHWKLQLAGYKWLPLANDGEDAVLYCFMFLAIAAHGAGRFALGGRRA
jgi:putative oxidoreductase